MHEAALSQGGEVQSQERRGRPSPAWLSPHRALALVASSMGVLGLPLALLGRQLRYDEIVYLSQFGRGLDPLAMSAPRAWGMPIMLAPVGSLTTSPLVLRLVLLGLSCIGLYLAFRPWLSLTERWVAPVAALLFATLWTTLLYASMAYPNIWLAWLGVGGIGLVLRALTAEPSRASNLAILLVFAAASLIRPTDAALLATPVAALALARRAWLPAIAIIGGVGVGWVAWLVEGYLRFGGPIQRLREASETNDAGLFLDPLHLLVSADGPELLCRPLSDCGPIDWLQVAWLVALPLLVGLGVIVARARLPLIVAATSALLLTAQYAFGFDWSSPRFLQPAFALLALPVATLAVWAARRGTAARVLIVVLVLAHVVLQGWQLVRVERELVAGFARVDAATAVIESAGVARPCAVFQSSALTVAFEAGCRPIPTRGRPDLQDAKVQEALADGERVVLILPAPPTSMPAGWTSTLASSRPARWVVVSPPAS